MSYEYIAHHLQKLRQALQAARPIPQLLAVSKYASLEQIKAAYAAGQRDFGESKVQILAEKEQALQDFPDIRWHFIGHLQTNKINALLKIPRLVAINAVDSAHLALALYQKMQAWPHHPPLEFFWQVNPVAQDQKHGIKTLPELQMLLEQWQQRAPLPNLKGIGLMVMSSLQNEDFAAAAEKTFAETKAWAVHLAQALQLPPLKLSMGMTSDYPAALKVGTDQVRIGSAIFQEDAG